MIVYNESKVASEDGFHGTIFNLPTMINNHAQHITELIDKVKHLENIQLRYYHFYCDVVKAYNENEYPEYLQSDIGELIEEFKIKLKEENENATGKI